MARKPFEMQQMLVASKANDEALAIARKQMDESVAQNQPGFRYKSEQIATQGKLLSITRTYEYSRAAAWSLMIARKLGIKRLMPETRYEAKRKYAYSVAGQGLVLNPEHPDHQNQKSTPEHADC